MKPKHIRAFKVRKQLFHLTDRGDGTLVVTSIHPYDEIEYHWAQQASKSCWRIYRCGKIVTTVCEYKGGNHPRGDRLLPDARRPWSRFDQLELCMETQQHLTFPQGRVMNTTTLLNQGGF